MDGWVDSRKRDTNFITTKVWGRSRGGGRSKDRKGRNGKRRRERDGWGEELRPAEPFSPADR